MKTHCIAFLLLVIVLGACKETKESGIKMTEQANEIGENITATEPEIFPISHATTVLNWDDTIIYADPTGGAEAFSAFNSADIILITDIHGDHLSIETLEAINTANATLIVPQAVADKLPSKFQDRLKLLNNGETLEVADFTVTAVPMYNLREEDKAKHPKGRGNGYIIEKKGKRVYFSGDTEDIPEMRNLEDINIAFVCMNLPYTMTVESAADAVLAFAPNKVYPYHYRGANGLSDVAAFKEIVTTANEDIEVIQLDWYPEMD